MLTSINDGHFSIRAKSIDKAISGGRTSKISKELASLPSLRKRVTAMTSMTLSEQRFKPIKELGPKFRGIKLFAYTNNSKVGYLRFYRSFSKKYWMKGLFLNVQLNKILKSFDGLDVLIIDVRFNIGGKDEFSFNVIGHLIEEELPRIIRAL